MDRYEIDFLEEPIPASEQPMAEVTPTAHKSRTEADCREVRPGLRFKVFVRDKFRCVACGRSPATHLNTCSTLTILFLYLMGARRRLKTFRPFAKTAISEKAGLQ